MKTQSCITEPNQKGHTREELSLKPPWRHRDYFLLPKTDRQLRQGHHTWTSIDSNAIWTQCIPKANCIFYQIKKSFQHIFLSFTIYFIKLKNRFKHIFYHSPYIFIKLKNHFNIYFIIHHIFYQIKKSFTYFIITIQMIFLL